MAPARDVALALVCPEVEALGARAPRLGVAHGAAAARRLYGSLGFEVRERFHRSSRRRGPSPA